MNKELIDAVAALFQNTFPGQQKRREYYDLEVLNKEEGQDVD